MSVSVAIAVFVAALAVSVVSSLVMAERVDQLGTWLRLSEGLLGVATALAADAPEIATAVTAAVGGNHDLGLGVVFGSNVFNLAGLLGVSAVTAGCVRVGRPGLWFDGGVGLAVLGAVAARLFGGIGNAAAVTLAAAVLVPYLLISAVKPEHVDRLAVPGAVRAGLRRLLAGTAHEKRKGETPEAPSATDLLGVVPALVAVVVASVWMVRSAIVLGNAWRVPHVLVGTLVLATLTGVPNLLAAVRLARRGRGTVVVSETLNSNSVNVIVGALAPAVVFGAGAVTRQGVLAVAWTGGLTVLALVLMSTRRGLTRAGGVALIAGWVAFIVAVVVVGGR